MVVTMIDEIGDLAPGLGYGRGYWGMFGGARRVGRRGVSLLGLGVINIIPS